MSNVLSLTTFLPILGVLLLLFIPKDSKGVLRNFTLAVTVVTRTTHTTFTIRSAGNAAPAKSNSPLKLERSSKNRRSRSRRGFLPYG